MSSPCQGLRVCCFVVGGWAQKISNTVLPVRECGPEHNDVAGKDDTNGVTRILFLLPHARHTLHSGPTNTPATVLPCQHVLQTFVTSTLRKISVVSIPAVRRDATSLGNVRAPHTPVNHGAPRERADQGPFGINRKIHCLTSSALTSFWLV